MESKERILEKLKQIGVLKSVKFIMLYGSQSDGTANPTSDIDLCISLDLPKKERSKIRHTLLSGLPSCYDIHIFEDLPLRVKIGVLKGKLLFSRQREQLIEEALQLKKEYEEFLPRYRYYITGVKHAERAYL